MADTDFILRGDAISMCREVMLHFSDKLNVIDGLNLLPPASAIPATEEAAVKFLTESGGNVSKERKKRRRSVMQTMANLESCPCCGGEAMLFQQGCGAVSPCEVWRKLALRCRKCGAEPFEQIEVRARIDADGNVVVIGNLDEVIGKWNRRDGTIVPKEGGGRNG